MQIVRQHDVDGVEIALRKSLVERRERLVKRDGSDDVVSLRCIASSHRRSALLRVRVGELFLRVDCGYDLHGLTAVNVGIEMVARHDAATEKCDAESRHDYARPG